MKLHPVLGLVVLTVLITAENARAQRPLGIDVSASQDLVNWTNVKSAGITFAWAKATESTNLTDAYFTNNAVNAKAADIEGSGRRHRNRAPRRAGGARPTG